MDRTRLWKKGDFIIGGVPGERVQAGHRQDQELQRAYPEMADVIRSAGTRPPQPPPYRGQFMTADCVGAVNSKILRRPTMDTADRTTADILHRLAKVKAGLQAYAKARK